MDGDRAKQSQIPRDGHSECYNVSRRRDRFRKCKTLARSNILEQAGNRAALSQEDRAARGQAAAVYFWKLLDVLNLQLGNEMGVRLSPEH